MNKRLMAFARQAIYDVAAPRSIANLPSGEWNACEITCDWPRLQVTQ